MQNQLAIYANNYNTESITTATVMQIWRFSFHVLLCLYNNRCTAWRNVSAVLACIKPPGMQLDLSLSVRASVGNHHTYIHDMCPLLYVRPQF